MAVSKGIYGLSGSGMDVDTMVKNMMQTQQARYDKMYKKKTKMEWKDAAYNDFYTSLNTFALTTMSTYKRQTTMSARAAKIADDKIASVKANGDAAEMTHDIQVKKLASNAYLQTTADGIKRDSTDPAKQKSMYLRDVLGITLPTEPTVPKAEDYAGGTADPNYIAAKNQYDIDKNIYDDKMGKVAISFTIRDKDGGEVAMQGGNPIIDNNGYNVLEDTKVISFTYGDLKEGTMNDLAQKITTSGLNLTASYDSVNDSFSVFNRSGGSSNAINIGIYAGGIKTPSSSSNGLTDEYIAAPDDIVQEQTAKLFNNLHLGQYTKNDDGNGGTLGAALSLNNPPDLATPPATGTDPVFLSHIGKSAEAEIDGRTYTADNNVITAGGVTYTINTVGATTVAVSGDADAVVENVKKFVEDYNKMLEAMNTKIYETRYKQEFDPLTEEEEDEMTEEQIKKWNEKAQSGILYHDNVLRNIVSELRSALSEPIDGLDEDYNSANKLGITVSWDPSKHGKIELEEDKLRAALSEDPDAAYKVFGTNIKNPNDPKDTSGQGIAFRLSSAASAGVKKIKDVAGSSAKADVNSNLGDQIISLEKKMSDFEDYMDSYETRLYKQFNAMETAIASLNSQVNFVSQYLGS